MATAQGINKSLRIKKQSAFGTAASGASAQELRRVTSNLSLEKDTYESAEIVTTAMVQDYRHGVRRVRGDIQGELSPATYKLLMQSALRRDFTTGVNSTALTNVTAAAGPPGTFTRAAGSFLTDGFKVGDVIRWTGWTTTGTNNNSTNFVITALTATVMTTNGTVAAKASGDSVTATVVGKKTYVPTSSHTEDYYTIEHWFSDVSLSEAFTDCRVGGMQLRLPATGMATCTFNVMGVNVTTNTSQNFTSPTAITSTGLTAAVNGALWVAGAAVAIVTGLEVNLDLGLNGEPVVGSNTLPAIFAGRSRVSGQLTAFFQDATLRDLFLNETEAGITVVLYTGTSATADLLAINLPRCKVGGASKDDGEKGIIQTLPFVGLQNSTGGAGTNSENSVISIQDSQA